jgi:hypothetical protein
MALLAATAIGRCLLLQSVISWCYEAGKAGKTAIPGWILLS